MPSLVLASLSPRRHELLDAAGIAHTVRASPVDETPQTGETPVDYVKRLAREKALAVDCTPNEIVLGADTTVVCEGVIFGKPLDTNDARRMLQTLSGKKHDVITGVCLRFGTHLTVLHDVTGVWFRALKSQDIDAYLLTGEPMDKAGAYAVQGIASRYIERLEGSYSNVVGLPVALVWRELEKLRNSLFLASAYPAEE